MAPFTPHLEWKAEYTGENVVTTPTQQIQSDIRHPPCLTFLKTKWREERRSSYFQSWTLNLSPNPLLFPLRGCRNKNDSPVIPRHCCQLFGRHRTEQLGPLSIINGPLVVLSTRPMHILKKYPVNMLCIGLVRRLDTKNQHPRNWCELCLPESAHDSLLECSAGC